MSNKVTIDLSGHNEVFESSELVFDKNITFIYGENGTGKSTIAFEIENQLKDKYVVRSFKDFTALVGENERLNAISLGRINAELQEQINKTAKKIDDLEKQLCRPEDKNEKNLFSNLQEDSNTYNCQKNKIDKILQKTASDIKNIKDPQIASTTYNKIALEKEISFAKALSDSEIVVAKNTATTKQKSDIVPIRIPENFKPDDIITTTNTILAKKVTPSIVIKAFDENTELREFARRGKELHQKGDKCAFCGNSISDERWAELDGYFNDEVSRFRKLIKQKIDKIEGLISDFKNFKIPRIEDFYPEMQEKADNVLLELVNSKNEVDIFLNKIKTSLIEKMDNLFIESKTIEHAVSEKIPRIIKTLNEIISENNTYSSNLAQKIKDAKDRLRYNEIYEHLERAKYSEEHERLALLQGKQKIAQDAYDEAKNNLDNEKKKLKNYYGKSRDESAIANKINETLSGNGYSSFSLKLATDDEFGQVGQYKVVGRNNEERDIVQLSTGEKNTVAILYFLYSLELDIEKASTAPLFVVIDDPVNSNDAAMRRIIMAEIVNLYKNGIFKEKSKIAILTHNTYFFINVRPYSLQKYKPKYRNYHLISGLNNKTEVKTIVNEQEDIRTDYDSLWCALVLGYYTNDADRMLSVTRKICLSFTEFNRIKLDEFCAGTGAKKLFDESCHEIISGEMSGGGITAASLKTLLERLFDKNGAKKHFETHWEYGEKMSGR